MPLDYLDIDRQPVPMLPLERRTGVTEVEVGYDAPAAMAEAQRCLHCWVNTIFEGLPEDGSMCILCGGCVDVCPEKCLELVSLDRIAVRARNRAAYPRQPGIVSAWSSTKSPRTNWEWSPGQPC